jgi:hypothetical protein
MECDADDKLTIKEFWRQFNVKMAIVIRFPFYAFSIYAAIRKNATVVYNVRRVLYILRQGYPNFSMCEKHETLLNTSRATLLKYCDSTYINEESG